MPLLIGERRWIPELEAEALLLHRIFLAEKWLVARLHYGHIDPREAGVGNIVNCGAAMYVAPVGIVNAGDPGGAYAEAIDVAGAHQSSYGREAAGVFAAAVAEAMRPGATVDDRRRRRAALAQDGTRAAIEAVVDAASGSMPTGARRSADAPRRRSSRSTRSARTTAHPRLDARDAEPDEVDRGAAGRARACSSLAGGDFREAVLGGVNYGRDSDSIATMAGAIAGALGGRAAVPAEWVARRSARRAGSTSPRRGATMAAVANDIWAKDASGPPPGRRPVRASTTSLSADRAAR